MQHILLKVDIYHLVIIDDGNRSTSAFTATCDVLSIGCVILSKRKYDALTIERFHSFKIKLSPLQWGDRGTLDVFVSVWTVSAYT